MWAEFTIAIALIVAGATGLGILFAKGIIAFIAFVVARLKTVFEPTPGFGPPLLVSQHSSDDPAMPLLAATAFAAFDETQPAESSSADSSASEASCDAASDVSSFDSSGSFSSDW